MDKFFRAKVFSPFVTLIIALAVGLVSIFITIPIARKGDISNGKNSFEDPVEVVFEDDQLYEAAIANAQNVTKNDIKDLVTITKDDPNTMWNGDKVLMIAYQNNMMSYNEGEKIEIDDIVWCYSGKELLNWYKKNGSSIENGRFVNRMNKLLGLRPEEGNSDFVGMWVDPSAIYRPAYLSDAKVNKMQTALPSDSSDDFRDFFEEQLYLSFYGDTSYPWTRLGYTYDWNYNEMTYGVSEFVIKPNTSAVVAFDLNNHMFQKWLEEN